MSVLMYSPTGSPCASAATLTMSRVRPSRPSFRNWIVTAS
nr:MAG TPA: hypothetical protein [Caudoviricetes sp.]